LSSRRRETADVEGSKHMEATESSQMVVALDVKMEPENEKDKQFSERFGREFVRGKRKHDMSTPASAANRFPPLLDKRDGAPSLTNRKSRSQRPRPEAVRSSGWLRSLTVIRSGCAHCGQTTESRQGEWAGRYT
jgi:hypothetical protein